MAYYGWCVMAGIPLLSDRSAFDVDNYPTRHASDLSSSTPKHHVPAGVTSGQTIQWDGSKWVLVTAAVLEPIVTLGTMEGDAQVAASPFKIYNRWGMSRTITEVYLSVSNAPVGAKLIVDVKVDGTSIFLATLAEIADGATTGVTTTFYLPTWASGSYLTWEVTQIGSSTPGANLVVHIKHTA